MQLSCIYNYICVQKIEEMVKVESLTFGYKNGPFLQFPDFHLNENEELLVLGASGIGKSTLVHLLCGLLTPKSGKIVVDEVDITKLSQKVLDNFRGKNIGIVFQRPHFIESLNVLDNLRVKIFFAHKQISDNANENLLSQLGIEELKYKGIKTLSQGQKQRLSIAIALIGAPKLLLADEPTANLDDKNCEIVINLLKSEAKVIGANLIVITHDTRIKSMFTNKLQL